MTATVIDTLRFADRLKAAGFEGPQAEGMARALGDELAERMLTRRDLDEALRPIHARLDSMEARFAGVDAGFEGVDARFESMEARFEARFEGVDARFESMEARFEGVDARFDSMEAKFDARFEGVDVKLDAVDAKIDSVHRELSGKFNVLVGVMALGFTLLAGLEGYNAIAPRFGQTVMEAPETLQEKMNLPGAPSSRPLAEGLALLDVAKA